MKVKKYQNPSSNLPRRRLKFTPEQIALFENLSTPTIPGTNNSEKLKLRTEGVLALLHLKREREKEAARIRSRSERPYVLKRKATLAERLRGGRDEYALTTQVIGMSGADPVGEFIVGGIGFGGASALGKTALWNVAKHAPTSRLGNWGRKYFVEDAFDNVVSDGIKYSRYAVNPAAKNAGEISRKGYRGPEIRYNPETGDFSIIPLSLLFEEKMKRIPENLIKDKNLKYERTSDLALIEDAGFIPKVSLDIGKFNRLYAEETIDRLKGLGYDTKEAIPIYQKGFNNYAVPETLIRDNVEKPVYLGYYTKGTSTMGTYYPTIDKAIADPTLSPNLPSVIFHERNMHGTDAVLLAYDDVLNLSKAKDMYLDFLDKLFYKKEGTGDVKVVTPRDKVSFSDNGETLIDFGGVKRVMPNGTDKWYEGRSTINELKRKYLYDVWEKQGKPETLAEVRELYKKAIDDLSEDALVSDLEGINGYGQIYTNLRGNNPNFIPDLKHLLKFGAAYGVPISVGGYVLSEKQGGPIHIKKKNRGKFTSYCGGKVTDSCIRRAKASGNPTLVKRATFAANARKWKHAKGGLIEKHQQTNGRGRGVLQIPNMEAYIQLKSAVPGTNTNSNRTVEEAKQQAEILRLETKTIKRKKKLKYTPRIEEAKKAVDFVLSYYDSPGFLEKFENLPELENADNPYDMYQFRYIKLPLKVNKIFGDDSLYKNASYNDVTHNIRLGNYKYGFYDNSPGYDYIAAHEMGHGVDNSILSQYNFKEDPNEFPWADTYKKYSENFPIFRESNAYNNFKSQLKDDDKKLFESIPHSYYNQEHDGLPGESYGDLMELRYALDKFNVFDSRIPNQEFLLHHLDELREKSDYIPFRIFDNFDDNLIIEMMNTIAYNKDNNKPLYFKNGGLIRKGWNDKHGGNLKLLPKWKIL